jgi:hypothetical protein
MVGQRDCSQLLCGAPQRLAIPEQIFWQSELELEPPPQPKLAVSKVRQNETMMRELARVAIMRTLLDIGNDAA